MLSILIKMQKLSQCGILVNWYIEMINFNLYIFSYVDIQRL